MKLNLTASLVLFILLPVFSIAQTHHYYYKGQQHSLTVNKQFVNVFTSNQFDESQLNIVGVKPFSMVTESQMRNNEYKKWSKIEFQNTPSTQTEYDQKIAELMALNNVEGVYPYYDTNTLPVGTSNFFYVKLKDPSGLIHLQNVAASKNVDIYKQFEYMPLWYVLSTNETTSGNSVTLSSEFYETGLFDKTDPAFMALILNDDQETSTTTTQNLVEPCIGVMDVAANQQWGLFDNPDFPMADINICEAWEVTKGTDATIAIIDTGINVLATEILVLESNRLLTSGPVNGPWYYDNQGSGQHGTSVAGIVGAQHNNVGIAGIAPNATILNVANEIVSTFNQEQIATGIMWAVVDKEAQVINMSFGNYLQVPLQALEDALNFALNDARNGLGAVLVAGSGNDSTGTVLFPANYDGVIAVGGSTEDGAFNSFNFGPELDLVAPSANIVTVGNGSSVGQVSGTSFATPHVAGVAALMLSANPCLTGQQVKNIMERTAQKSGYDSGLDVEPEDGYTWNLDRFHNGYWFQKMGYGIVDAKACVLTAAAVDQDNIDLSMRNSLNDYGFEPDNVTRHASNVLWNSPDIWVRNFQDGVYYQEHQNPVFTNVGDENYVYVKITNKSCYTSSGDDDITLYWSSSPNAYSWPDLWTGNLNVAGEPQLGNVVDTLTIPSLEPGEDIILQFDWVVPNPDDYSSSDFSFLARLESTDDPIPPQANTLSVWTNAKYSNNIVWKNVEIILPGLQDNDSMISYINISNFDSTPKDVTLEFSAEVEGSSNLIFQEAEVSLQMDNELYQNWTSNGSVHSNMLNKGQQFLVNNNSAVFENITLAPNETRSMKITFNFLVDELSEKKEFYYHFIQRDKETEDIVGAKMFKVLKGASNQFDADAGEDKEIDKNESVTLSATDINEPATYNWYDLDGNLISSGMDITLSPDITQKYKLEVITTSDGFKDYDEINVEVNPFVLEVMSPNPANNQVTINYIAENATSAYLILRELNTNNTNNYILNPLESSKTLDVSNYNTGIYFVSFICNGDLIDSTTLIVQ